MSEKAGTIRTAENITKKKQSPCCVYDFTLFDEIDSMTIKLQL
jgi:hypothetical protein